MTNEIEEDCIHCKAEKSVGKLVNPFDGKEVFMNFNFHTPEDVEKKRVRIGSDNVYAQVKFCNQCGIGLLYFGLSKRKEKSE